MHQAEAQLRHLQYYAKKPTTPPKKKAAALELAELIQAARDELDAANAAAKKASNKHGKLVGRVTEFTSWQN